MIWILSAGRSGSAWLSTVFAAMGARTIHEGFIVPYKILNPEVIAETSLIWDVKQFSGCLSANDVVVILDRDEAKRTESVHKLLGKRDYGPVDENWTELKAAARASPARLFELQYENLFDLQTRDTVRSILFAGGFPTDNLNNFWAFLIHQRVTNMTSEQICKESLGL